MPDPKKSPRPPVTLRALLTGLPPLPLKEGPLQPVPPSVPEAGDRFLQVGDFLRGVLGLPFGAESQANLAGQLAGTVLPFVGGGKRALGAVVREGEAVSDAFAAAKALYRERGHGGRQSMAGMAQALKDTGYKFGPMRTAAQKREANAFVEGLVQQADAAHASGMVPDSPFVP